MENSRPNPRNPRSLAVSDLPTTSTSGSTRRAATRWTMGALAVSALALGGRQVRLGLPGDDLVDVRTFGAIGDGENDDSRAIQAAIDANKGGRIVLPAGRTFLAAGVTLSGPSYNGTSLIISGILRLKPSEGRANWDVSVSPTYNGLILHDVERVTVDVPGMIDGNRLKQTPWQQHHCLHIRGGRDIDIPTFNAREVRGDGIVITSSTNVPPFVAEQNPARIRIGKIRVENTSDDGRNALSIISGEDIVCESLTSLRVGGMIAGERMPGGLDIESDGNWHRVARVRVKSAVVVTAGTSGIAVIGQAISNDAARVWTTEDIHIERFSLLLTGDAQAPGGAIFRRLRRGTLAGSVQALRRQAPAISIDAADEIKARFTGLTGARDGVVLGPEDWVQDSEIHVEVSDHSGAGVRATGVNRTVLTGTVRGGQGAGSYGVQIAPGGRGRLHQAGVRYSLNVPFNPMTTFGLLASAGMIFDPGCAATDCSFDNYPSFETQFGLASYLRSSNVRGRNWSSAPPSNGSWTRGDVVRNTAVNDTTAGWTRLTDGARHRIGTDWAPIIEPGT